MRKAYTTILYILFLLFILTLPFNSIYDTIAFFQGTVGDKTYSKTPIWFKLYKDLFLFCAIGLTLVNLVLRMNKKLIGLSFFLLLASVYTLLSFTTEPSVAVIIAMRSYLTVFFVFLGFYFYYFDPAQVYPLMKFILVIEIMVQVLQVFYAPNYYGQTYFFGYNSTNPGTFLIPSTMASFAILVLYYARQHNARFIEVLCILSVLLSRSSTAYLILIIFYCVMIAKHFRFSPQLIMAVLTVVSVLIYFNIDAITGRQDIINNLISRLDIFQQAVDNPFGKGFGLGSGGAVLLHVEDAVIADSTLNSLLINFGWTGFLVYGFMLFMGFKYFRFDNLLLIAFACFSITMIIFEMTPFIQFFFFELGRMIRAKRDEMITEVTSIAA